MEYVPNSSTSAKIYESFSAILKISFPCLSFKNSPLAFNNFKAFHCFGLCDAVKIIPPSAFSKGTAISTVGVVDKPKSITLMPKPTKVLATKLLTILPEIRASRPMTTVKGSVETQLGQFAGFLAASFNKK